MHLPNRILLALSWLVTITLVGSAGYVVLEGMSWVDALYMTTITISTVGFGEVVPLGTVGRIWTILLIMLGVGTALYFITLVAEIVFDGGVMDHLRRVRMRKQLEDLTDHVIIAGFGRFGRTVISELESAHEDIVVIEQDPDLESELDERGLPHVIGSATQDDVLERAGITRARALVIATSSDSDNVFITLSARELAPEIRIHARGESEATLRRLERAGADHVVSPYHLGGIRTAASVMQPTVVDFVELISPRGPNAVNLEEIRIESGAPLDGRTVGSIEREYQRLRIVALKRAEVGLAVLPEPDDLIASGDQLVVIGRDVALLAAAVAARCPDERTAD